MPFFFIAPISEGIPGKTGKTEILYDIENSLLQGVRFMRNAKKIDMASDKSGP
jgi:hypothetical protein